MITGWRSSNRLHNRLLCYPFVRQARASIIKMEPEIVKNIALSNCGSANDDLHLQVRERDGRVLGVALRRAAV